jgi:hypothetical protein
VSENEVWTSPDDIHGQLMRCWDQGRILSARMTGLPLFPLTLRMRRPTTGELSARFAEAQKWIRGLKEGSKETRGHGYEIEWAEVKHRQLGANLVPVRVLVSDETEALKLIRRTREAERFQAAADATMAAFPELHAWMGRRVVPMLEALEDWDRILAVLRWFRDHPRSGLYLRQMDVAGVHTKFVERHRPLLGELLDLVLPVGSVDEGGVGARGFEQRYGFRSKPPLVRFRILDDRLAISGMSDLSIPAADFAKLQLPVRQVFMTENEVNGLAFPETEGSLVIFGLGYGLDRLSQVDWLKRTPVSYWGDLDTHGFAMLSRLRIHAPQAKSFLMDRETLMEHQPMWGQELANARFTGPLTRLTEPELALFEDLRQDRLGERIRLEQEHVSFGWISRKRSIA